MKKYLFFLLLLVSGCENTTVFKDYQTITDEQWCIENKVKFKPQIEKGGNYQINLMLRHTTDYEMANLWCFITLRDSNRIINKDTLNLKLAEPDGRWLGKGNTIKEIDLPLRQNNLYLSPGEYTLEIEQGMRIKCLKGIKNVGVSISKIQPE